LVDLKVEVTMREVDLEVGYLVVDKKNNVIDMKKELWDINFFHQQFTSDSKTFTKLPKKQCPEITTDSPWKTNGTCVENAIFQGSHTQQRGQNLFLSVEKCDE